MAARVEHFLGIDPKIYRHFAVATVAISLTIAMFADGGKRDVIEEAYHQNQQKLEMKRAQDKKFGATPIADHRGNARGGGWGSEGGGSYGQPMDSAGSDSGSAARITGGAPAPVIAEIDPRLLATMNPTQRASYLKSMEEERRRRQAQPPSQPSQTQIAGLIASSQARSGAPESD
ncbi:hypothetical protein [Novosphingobium lentum]|uniref:hypothetical protein n=1 Tax=Novosphingobium lentum TaxID=145287 RepID=UPI000829BB87|nr:hypothetical protein [Novosphingobium lentum]